jgi:hypothetical protein
MGGTRYKFEIRVQFKLSNIIYPIFGTEDLALCEAIIILQLGAKVTEVRPNSILRNQNHGSCSEFCR